MTYIHWMSTTECESRYQRRDPHPWESNYSKPGPKPQNPGWMKKSSANEGTLKGVDEALLGYERGRTRETFTVVQEACRDWGSSTAYRAMERDPTRQAAVGPALQEMARWLKAQDRWWARFEQRDVLAEFSLAAQTLIKAFPMMPELYKNALQETFVSSGITSEKIYCIKWYPDLDNWTRRLSELGANSTLAEGANAFTVGWSGTNPGCKTKHKY